jgi:hypothetical protein
MKRTEPDSPTPTAEVASQTTPATRQQHRFPPSDTSRACLSRLPGNRARPVLKEAGRSNAPLPRVPAAAVAEVAPGGAAGRCGHRLGALRVAGHIGHGRLVVVRALRNCSVRCSWAPIRSEGASIATKGT